MIRFILKAQEHQILKMFKVDVSPLLINELLNSNKICEMKNRIAADIKLMLMVERIHNQAKMRMNYHLVLTRKCNLNCEYCHGGEEAGESTEITYTLDELAKFLSRNPDSQIMFYEGEPILSVGSTLKA